MAFTRELFVFATLGGILIVRGLIVLSSNLLLLLFVQHAGSYCELSRFLTFHQERTLLMEISWYAIFQ